MNYGLYKQLTLLTLLIFTVINLIYGLLGGRETLLVQTAFFVVYILLTFAELKQIQIPKEHSTRHYYYLTNGIISLNVIKIVSLFVVALVFYNIGTKLMQLSGLVITMVVGDLLLFIGRCVTKKYFIAVNESGIYFMLDKTVVLQAKDIELAEFRYNIFYFNDKHKKNHLINLENFKPKVRIAVQENICQWLESNKVKVSSEAKQALKLSE